MAQPSIGKSLFKETSIDFKENNVSTQPLVNPEKGSLLPLHIKLGLMKISVKGIDQNGTLFL
jgi:hypothetical protein